MCRWSDHILTWKLHKPPMPVLLSRDPSRLYSICAHIYILFFFCKYAALSHAVDPVQMLCLQNKAA